MISFIIWDLDPVIFHGVDFFRWYGCCWAIGMILGYEVLSKMYRREGLSQSALDKVTVYLVGGVIVGARLGHIIFYDPAYYFANPIEILPIQVQPTFRFTGFAGLASHGGVLGALCALYLYSKKHKVDLFNNLDSVTVVAALLGGFIRLGNLMNSEILGIPSDVPWAFVFTRIDQVPRHPAQLYEALFYFSIFFLLFHLWRSGKVKRNKGFLFGLGLSLIFFQRFLVEFFKENQVSFESGFQLNMGQLLSVPFTIIGIFITWRSVRNLHAINHHHE
jgi:prolipoprotein diacylglyceryl transferase